ncbi:hypothetical protein Hanom_Chr10g00901221 [Helianthus anomalus]
MKCWLYRKKGNAKTLSIKMFDYWVTCKLSWVTSFYFPHIKLFKLIILSFIPKNGLIDIPSKRPVWPLNL